MTALRHSLFLLHWFHLHICPVHSAPGPLRVIRIHRLFANVLRLSMSRRLQGLGCNRLFSCYCLVHDPNMLNVFPASEDLLPALTRLLLPWLRTTRVVLGFEPRPAPANSIQAKATRWLRDLESPHIGPVVCQQPN